jgi:dihydroflavonol-4-reductase
MLVCVLGSTGCIGNNIVRACLDAGWEVRAFHRATSPTWVLDELAVERAVGDLADGDSLRAAMRGCQVVFHAAAHYPLHSLDIAASVRHSGSEMRTVLRAARQSGVGRLVYTSSLTTVGPPEEPGRPSDERSFYLPGSTQSAYFEAKWAAESEAWRAIAEGLPVVIVNPTVTFGPWDVKPATGEILVRVARGQLPIWVDRQLNVVDARDVARGHVLAAERGRVGQRYILGANNVPLREMLHLAAQYAGVRPARWQVSTRTLNRLVAVGEALGRLPGVRPLPLEHLKTMRHWHPLSVEKARQELGHTYRPLAETIQDTLAWFRSHGYL